MKKYFVSVCILFLMIGCGSGGDGDVSGTNEKGVPYADTSGSAPRLIEAAVYDDYFEHVPPKVWRIGEFMRFEIEYQDDDGDAETLEMTIISDGNIYAGPYIFQLAPGAGSYYSYQDYIVEGEPGVYGLEFVVTDSKGNESETLKGQVGIKE